MASSYEKASSYEYYGEYQSYISNLGKDNSESHNMLIKNLSKAISEELTPRQRQAVTLYYIDRLKMKEIADIMGVGVPTVSRTVKRGREKLSRCLRYGARELLRASLKSDS